MKVTNSKYNRDIVMHVPYEMVDEIERLAEMELLDRAPWMKRALLNEINRLRKLRGEDVFWIKVHKRGPKAKDKK